MVTCLLQKRFSSSWLCDTKRVRHTRQKKTVVPAAYVHEDETVENDITDYAVQSTSQRQYAEQLVDLILSDSMKASTGLLKGSSVVSYQEFCNI